MAAASEQDAAHAWAVAVARASYRSGVPPSDIIRTLWAERLRYMGTIHLVRAFHKGFQLSLGECKEATKFYLPDDARVVDDAINAYLIPLIERSRNRWDSVPPPHEEPSPIAASLLFCHDALPWSPYRLRFELSGSRPHIQQSV